MASIELPDEVYTAAQRAAGLAGVDLTAFVTDAITARAPLDTGDEFPFDDGGFPVVIPQAHSAAA